MLTSINLCSPNENSLEKCSCLKKTLALEDRGKVAFDQ